MQVPGCHTNLAIRVGEHLKTSENEADLLEAPLLQRQEYGSQLLLHPQTPLQLGFLTLPEPLPLQGDFRT